MDLKLNGKKALIAGSSRGLGFAVALQLAAEGAEVTLNGRNQAGLISAQEKIQEATGAKTHGFACDLGAADAPARLVDDACDAMGGLDILITNSGGPRPGRFETMTDVEWLNAFNLLLMSHVRMIRQALPWLRKSATPAVLTITSYSVKQPIPDLVLSNSVRAATVGLTKTLALELGAEGIRFNSILPGWTDTERIQGLLKDRAETNKSSLEDELAKQAADIPLKRIATPAEFAYAAVFLVSPLASYITGTMLSVDGGTVKSLL